MPVFGLYENFSNTIIIDISFNDNSQTSLEYLIDTPPYDDPQLINKDMYLRKVPSINNKPSFSFFMLKPNTSNLESRNDYSYGPVILDIDGNIRWARNVPNEEDNLYKISRASKFHNSKIISWDVYAEKPTLLELDLLGGLRSIEIKNSKYILDDIFRPHHDIRYGKDGYLIEVNVSDVNNEVINGQVLIEVNNDGEVIKEFDFGEIIANYIDSNGDDPSTLVRPPVNWFHGNSSIYDPSDNSIITSSRENFIIKVGYDTKEIIWIFGDPNKHWFVNYPSLRKLALTTGADYPIGQHSLSIDNDSLMFFNNGVQSFRNPENTPAGASLISSKLSKYDINKIDKTAQRSWNYDSGISSGVCSSVFRDNEGDYLVNYSSSGWDITGGPTQKTESIYLGLGLNKDILFEFSITTNPCLTSWNTDIVDLNNLQYN